MFRVALGQMTTPVKADRTGSNLSIVNLDTPGAVGFSTSELVWFNPNIAGVVGHQVMVIFILIRGRIETPWDYPWDIPLVIREQMWFWQQQYLDRIGTVAGRRRTDIAAGSTGIKDGTRLGEVVGGQEVKSMDSSLGELHLDSKKVARPGALVSDKGSVRNGCPLTVAGVGGVDIAVGPLRRRRFGAVLQLVEIGGAGDETGGSNQAGGLADRRDRKFAAGPLVVQKPGSTEFPGAVSSGVPGQAGITGDGCPIRLGYLESHDLRRAEGETVNADGGPHIVNRRVGDYFGRKGTGAENHHHRNGT